MMAVGATREVIPGTPEHIHPFKGATFYVDPHSLTASWVKDNQSNPDHKALSEIAKVPMFIWLAEWNGADPGQKVRDVMKDAVGKNNTAQFAPYNRPLRDASGDYSKGGAESLAAYRTWTDKAEAGLYETDDIRVEKNLGVQVVIEADGVVEFTSFKEAQNRKERAQAITYAVMAWGSHPLVYTYIDFGHKAWVVAPKNPQKFDAYMEFLIQCGIQHARGFSVNVSNFRTTAECIEFAEKVCDTLEEAGFGRKFYLIDTSRNGRGPLVSAANQPFNPKGRGLGEKPIAFAKTMPKRCDGYAWIKDPAQSDGDHNPGDPPAGQIHPGYASQLYKNRVGESWGVNPSKK